MLYQNSNRFLWLCFLNQVQKFFLHFWQGMPEHILTILSCPEVIKLIGICDEILFKVRNSNSHLFFNVTDYKSKVAWEYLVTKTPNYSWTDIYAFTNTVFYHLYLANVRIYSVLYSGNWKCTDTRSTATFTCQVRELTSAIVASEHSCRTNYSGS